MSVVDGRGSGSKPSRVVRPGVEGWMVSTSVFGGQWSRGRWVERRWSRRSWSVQCSVVDGQWWMVEESVGRASMAVGSGVEGG